MTPIVSIVIPVYNTEAYLRECLDSILGQTLRELEVICIDDCSSDSSSEILAEYAHKDDRVRVFRQPENMKPGAARNRGLENARGRYVYFMDSDDLLFDPSSLKEMTKTADSNSLDLLLFSSATFVDGIFPEELRPRIEKLQTEHSVPETLCGRVLPGPDLLAEIIQEKCYSPCIWLRLYKTGMLREADIRFLPNNIHEDTLFTPLTHFFSKRSMAVQTTVLNRRIRPGSIMTESAFGVNRFLNTYQITQEWAKTPLPSFLNEAGRKTWSEISSKLLGHACKAFYQINDPQKQMEILLAEFSSPETRLMATSLLHVSKRLKSIDTLKAKIRSAQLERQKIIKEKSKADETIKALKRKLEKARNERDSRPDSIRSAIAFIFRRIKKRSLSAFWGQARTRT